MFSIDVSLRDWEIEATGIDNVIEANTKIFNSVETIVINPLRIYQEQQTVIAEIEIVVNDTEKILVTKVPPDLGVLVPKIIVSLICLIFLRTLKFLYPK